METVHKVVDAIWGQGAQEQPQPQVRHSSEQHGDEPLSGVQGKGIATDPYDAGNRDEQPGAPETESNTALVTGPPPKELTSDTISNKRQEAATKAESEISPGTAKKPETATKTETAAKPETQTEPPTVEQPSREQESSNVAGGSSQNDSTINQKVEQRGQDQSKDVPAGESSKQPTRKNETTESKPSNSTEGDSGRQRDVKVSEEALRGPKTPAPREAYEFEKKMDGAPSKTQKSKPNGAGGGAATDTKKAQQGDAHNDDKAAHHQKPLAKMKDKLGRVVNNHLHHTNK